MDVHSMSSLQRRYNDSPVRHHRIKLEYLLFSKATLLLHCYYSPSYLIVLFCPSGVTGPPCADYYLTAPSLLCGWSDGLEWSPGFAAPDASGPLCSISLWS